MSKEKSDYGKSNNELIQQLQALKRRNKELEALNKDRKRTEVALRIQSAYFEDLIEGAPEAIVILDNQDRIQRSNREFSKIFEYSAEEAMGKRINDLIVPPELKEEGLKATGDVGRGKTMRLETVRQTRSGKRIHVSILGNPIKHEGNQLAVYGIYRDITPQKKAEEERREYDIRFQQMQRMESIGTLAGGIAHNFNNILMGIQGHTSLMIMDKEPSHPDLNHLNSIKEAVRTAVELTQQLLGFARGGRYAVMPIDLNALIKRENSMFGQTKKETLIHGKYEQKLWVVEADPGQMQQVLLNLYVNAWQALPKGGNIYIQTENLVIKKDNVKPPGITPGRYVKISVTDNGTGMDEKTRQKIFEPFFSTRDRGGNTGLGLASVYGIIKNHGGFINVSSAIGKGTTFDIYLPASDKKIPRQKKAAKKILKGDETILLIDDEPVIIQVGRELLERLGYRVLTALGGKKAVRIYEKNKAEIKLVILDMIMPVIGGYETFDRLKAINPDVWVLLSSGYSQNGQAAEIMNKGCKGFLQKPFSLNELSESIRSILESK